MELDLDRNGVVDNAAFVQGLRGNAGMVRQTSRTGALLSERMLPATLLRVRVATIGPCWRPSAAG